MGDAGHGGVAEGQGLFGCGGPGIDGQPLQAQVQVCGPHPILGSVTSEKLLLQSPCVEITHSFHKHALGATEEPRRPHLGQGPRSQRGTCGGDVAYTPSKLLTPQWTPAGVPLSPPRSDTRYLQSGQIPQVEAQSPRLSPPPLLMPSVNPDGSPSVSDPPVGNWGSQDPFLGPIN